MVPMPDGGILEVSYVVKQSVVRLLWNNFTHVKTLHIYRCENYLQKYCANICVIHIYFVLLQRILEPLIL